MDWKLERERRQKIQSVEEKEASQSVNIFAEMEREFTHIFGEGRKADFSPAPKKSGGAVLGAARSPKPGNAQKRD